MNRRFITATRIEPIQGSLPHDPVLVFEDQTLVDITTTTSVADERIERYNGTLVPGFVNAHCHLELSYMRGKIQPGTGLTHFLHEVVTHPPVPEEEILEAIVMADREMWEAGIVAVGDISNRSATIHVKSNSRIAYYTFVEMFDFLDPEYADRYFRQYQEVYQAFRQAGLENVTQVPHSPYTVSDQLAMKIADTVTAGKTGSIHMLENDQETRLLEGESSEYYDFFKSLGFDLDHFNPPGFGSMECFLRSGYRPSRILFVHNTVARAQDLDLMKQYRRYGKPWLVTCPNANLYIESRLPDYAAWIASGLPVCIGTDSYSSNHQLSIWNEICTIKSGFGEISWEELFRWATLNGAEALGMDDKLGSLEIGKIPGLVLLETHQESPIDEFSAMRRIV